MNHPTTFFSFFSLCLSWLLPHHYAPWMTAFQDTLAIAAILILSLAYGLQCRMQFPRIVILFFLVLPIPLIQAFTGQIWFWGDAWIAFLYLLSFCLAFMVGFNAKAHRGGCETLLSWLFASILIGACLSVMLAARQWLLQPAGVWGIEIVGARPSANMGQPNNYASLLLMALFGVLYFFERNVLGRAIAVFLTIFLLLGIALGQSRTSWIMSLFFLGFFLYKSQIISFKLRFWHVAVGVMMYASFVILLPAVSELLFLSSTNLADRAKAAARWDIYQMFTAAISEGGLWGYGWTQVALAQIAVASDYPLGLRVSQSHNLLLDILLWNGPLIGGAIILVLGVWLAGVCRRIKTPLAFYALMAFFALLIHGMLEFPLEYAYFLMPAGLFLGVVCCEAEKPVGFTPRWLWLAMVILVMVVGGRAVYEYIQLEDEYRQVRMESVRVIPKEDDRILPDIFVLSQLEAMITVFRMDAQDGLSSAELAYIGKAAHRYPNHYLLNLYALTLAENGCIPLALKQVDLIKALHGETEYRTTKKLVDARIDVILERDSSQCSVQKELGR